MVDMRPREQGPDQPGGAFLPLGGRIKHFPVMGVGGSRHIPHCMCSRARREGGIGMDLCPPCFGSRRSGRCLMASLAEHSTHHTEDEAHARSQWSRIIIRHVPSGEGPLNVIGAAGVTWDTLMNQRVEVNGTGVLFTSRSQAYPHAWGHPSQ